MSSGGTQAYSYAPASGYHVASLSVDGGPVSFNPAGGTYTFTNVLADHAIDVTFAANTYTLTYTAGANGSISGSSPQTVPYLGSGTAVTAVADPGYHFVDWSDGSTANPRTDTNVTVGKSVTANFAADAPTAHPLTVQDPGGSGATLYFPSVISEGSTTIDKTGNSNGTPVNFRLIGDAHFDIASTAAYDPAQGFDVTLPYDPAQVAPAGEADVKLFHFSGGSWHDITTSVNFADNTVTGHATAFSPFAVMAPTGGSGGGETVNTDATSTWGLALMLISGVACVALSRSRSET